MVLQFPKLSQVESSIPSPKGNRKHQLPTSFSSLRLVRIILVHKLAESDRSNLKNKFLYKKAGHLSGIFLKGDKIYCYANFFFYAKVSIVFVPNLRGGQKSLRGANCHKIIVERREMLHSLRLEKLYHIRQ